MKKSPTQQNSPAKITEGTPPRKTMTRKAGARKDEGSTSSFGSDSSLAAGSAKRPTRTRGSASADSSGSEKETKEKERSKSPPMQPSAPKRGKTEVSLHLRMLLKNGLLPAQQRGVVEKQRQQIQGDPDVVRALGRHMKELKAIYDHYGDRSSKRQFRWKTSALRLFEKQE